MKRRAAANAVVRVDVDYGGDPLGEAWLRNLRGEAAIRLQGAGGTVYGGAESDPTATFGGALPAGPQAFVHAAGMTAGTGHVYADPADNRMESGTGNDIYADPAARIFAARLTRRRS